MEQRVPSRSGKDAAKPEIFELDVPFDIQMDVLQPFQSGIVADHLVQKILKRTDRMIYSTYLDRQLNKFSIEDSLHCIDSLVTHKYKFHDNGENLSNIKNHRALRAHNWDESEEPVYIYIYI